MDNKWANIDVVFRNGLKDFEVLPPAEVWEKIHPVIVQKQRPFTLLRAAAMTAIILTMSFFAYQWSRQISSNPNIPVAFIDESFSPVNGTEIVRPPVISRRDIRRPVISQNEIIPVREVLTDVPDFKTKWSSDNISFNETEGFALDDALLSKGPELIAESEESILNYEIGEYQEYFPPMDEPVKANERWSIAALASPTYYSSFNSGSDDMTKLLASEQQLISYSGGVSFAYKLNKRFSIQSGLFFSSVGQELGGVNSFGGFKQYNESKGSRYFELSTANGTVYTNNADVFLIADGPDIRIATSFTEDVFDPQKANLQYINDNLTQNFSYLELPIILRYKLLDKTIDFNIIGGVSYNMLVNNSVYTMVDGGKYLIGKTEGLNMITLSSSLGMGMEYSFSENLSLNLEPTFRYYHNPFSKLAPSGTHPYSFGIFSGISYKF